MFMHLLSVSALPARPWMDVNYGVQIVNLGSLVKFHSAAIVLVLT